MTSIFAGSVVHPKVYAYTAPHLKQLVWEGARPGKGVIKVGKTTQEDAEKRILQAQGVNVPKALAHTTIMVESAIRDDGRVFTDSDVHQVLVASGVHRLPASGKGGLTEFFECTEDEVRAAITAVREGKAPEDLIHKQSFGMRDEQVAAVEQTAAYFEAHAGDGPPHYLWNAKMRFGKTFTAYQLAKKMGWSRVLVLTYKPAVEKGWRKDLLAHTAFEGWRFKGKGDPIPDLDDPSPLVWFASFQDVLGTDENRKPKVKNEDLYLDDWDVVVIDEYHFGAWRDAARSLYRKDEESGTVGDSTEARALDTPDLEDGFVSQIEDALTINIGHYLYLSGTPFRALTEGEFLEDQIFNWTYSDEQRTKETWDKPEPNPYASLPKMFLMAYEMPEALKEIAINNQAEFSLTEFFRTEKDAFGTPTFVHRNEVQKWLDLLRGQDIGELWGTVSAVHRPPLPYEDVNLLEALQHSVWYLPDVASCQAMHDLLTAQHNTFFRDYQVLVAAGSAAGMGAKALDPVETSIGPVPQDTKSITLTCGKLMTGVTVPAWTAIFMLRELKSPETYFQAAFRVQSPWVSKFVNTTDGGVDELIHKKHCYVFDFSPNRALRLVTDYATRLRSDQTLAEQDDEADIEEFMAFMPVLSYSGHAMQQLRAADVIDYLTRGISASMLARRWNSSELITLDLASAEALLANKELIASLEQIEMFRNISDDLTAIISTNKELGGKSVAKEKLSSEERQRKDDATKRRDDIKKRLRRFLTRIPTFMYLTDDRERTVWEVINQVEPELFQKVTGLTLNDFEELVNARVFNDAKMNDAVWKFRDFEEPSLSYGDAPDPDRTVGGWTQRRDQKLADLINRGILPVGTVLTGQGTNGEAAACVVSDDYGLSIGGIRYESPDHAAEAATGGSVTDGWNFWQFETTPRPLALSALAKSLKR